VARQTGCNILDEMAVPVTTTCIISMLVEIRHETNRSHAYSCFISSYNIYVHYWQILWKRTKFALKFQAKTVGGTLHYHRNSLKTIVTKIKKIIIQIIFAATFTVKTFRHMARTSIQVVSIFVLFQQSYSSATRLPFSSKPSVSQ
jgi:hypothetical protein